MRPIYTYRYLSIFIALLLFESCTSTPPPPEIAIVNAIVWTADDARPYAEAVLIKGNTIDAVGTTKEITQKATANTRLIDANKAMITPGFIDSHVHFVTGGFRLSSVQLRDANTPELFIKRIAQFARTLEPGEWIIGGDWDHELWGGELPSKSWIDAVTPHNPVWISRLDGHMALANSLALEEAGITKDTPDVFGGTIVRDETGEPTGILKDNAMDLLWPMIPAPGLAQQTRAIEAAMDYVNARGVTSVQHMGTLEHLAVFEQMRKENRLSVRIYAASELSRWQELKAYIDEHGSGDSWFKKGALKGFVDGSLGSHTAAFFDPYTDSPEDRGLLLNKPEQLETWVRGATEAGLHVTIHAIGDRAIHTLLNIYEEIGQGKESHRFKIEHVQHLSPADIPRFSSLNVIASMQPYHAIDDGRWAERVIGPERIKTTYAFHSLLDANTRVVFGSDWFVAPPVPLEGIYAAVTRSTLDDKNPDGWVPQQKISVEAALKAYTIDAAYASFEETQKGSISPGKLADLVILEKDLTAIPPEQIRDVDVLLTMVNGKIVFIKDGYKVDYLQEQ